MLELMRVSEVKIQFSEPQDLIEAGIDGVNPVEPMAGTKIKEIKEKYPKLIIVGGLDNSNMLTSWTFEQIEEATGKPVKDGAEDGGFMIGTSQVHPACDPKRVLKMWEYEIKYGRYKK